MELGWVEQLSRTESCTYELDKAADIIEAAYGSEKLDSEARA